MSKQALGTRWERRNREIMEDRVRREKLKESQDESLILAIREALNVSEECTCSCPACQEYRDRAAFREVVSGGVIKPITATWGGGGGGRTSANANLPAFTSTRGSVTFTSPANITLQAGDTLTVATTFTTTDEY